MALTPWERSFLAALERGPMTASAGLIEAGRDWAHTRPVQVAFRRACGPTCNGTHRERDTRLSGWERQRRRKMAPKETAEEKAIREADEALDRAGSQTGSSADDKLNDPALDILSDWRDDIDNG